MILLIGGEKGGTGKSTIATNLAVVLAHAGQEVMLVNADPQPTASRWIERRNEAGILPEVFSVNKTGDVFRTVLDLGRRYGVVIVDAGGRDSKELRTAMAAANVMLVPLRASQPDLETLPHVNELVGLARGLNPSLQAHAVLSIAPTHPQINEVAEAREFLADFSELALVNAVIRDRKAYRDAMIEGCGVIEMDDAKAAAEIQQLAKELGFI